MNANAQQIEAWVDAASALHSLHLDATRREAVIDVFTLLASMAERVGAVPLPPESEPAPVYRP